MLLEDEIEIIRQDFPLLNRQVNGKPLIYFDNAASTLKPATVINTISHYYRAESSNIHRGVHYLSELGTQNYENSREAIKVFLNAKHSEEIIFTSGTTHSINLIAINFNIQKNQEIIITAMEHHSNIVPWQMLCQRTGAKLRIVPFDDNGELIIEEYEKLLSEKTALVSMLATSNTLGTINNLKPLITMAHKVGAKFMVDAAQSIGHQKIDVQSLDCDFLAFSGHKFFAPTGIGVLYGKKNLLEQISPLFGGGDMVDKVTFEKTTYAELPSKLEAGTPHVAGVIGLGEAIKYINNIGFDIITKIENKQTEYLMEKVNSIPQIKILGKAQHKCPLVTFTINNIHPHDLGTFLDQDGIAIRTGHHCTQPIMDYFNVSSTCRASLCFYNNFKEIDYFIERLQNNIMLLE